MRRSQQRSDFLTTPELGKITEYISILVWQAGPEFVVGRQWNPFARVWLLLGFRIIDWFAGTATLFKAYKYNAMYNFFLLFLLLCFSSFKNTRAQQSDRNNNVRPATGGYNTKYKKKINNAGEWGWGVILLFHIADYLLYC